MGMDVYGSIHAFINEFEDRGVKEIYPKVDVYWNLHRKCWSVKSRERHFRYGTIILHAVRVDLIDAHFVVQDAGRQRVLRDKTKNVHAFARGRLVRPPTDAAHSSHPELPQFWHFVTFPNVVCSGVRGGTLWYRCSYNPYKSGHFTDDIGNPVSPYTHRRMICYSNRDVNDVWVEKLPRCL